MSNALAGSASITIDGQRYLLVGSLTYRPSNDTRETLKGQDGPHGYKSMPETGKIGGTFRDNSAISVQALGAGDNVTVVAQLLNGKTIVGRNMWRVGDPPEVNTEEGTFEINWESLDVSEN